MTVRTARRRSLASAQATRNATAEVADAVAAQTEKAHQDPLWSAVMAGDEGKLLPLLRANPALLAERGPVGETPFLMLILYGKVQLAKRVAGLYPEVVDGRYEGGEYHGENALHIAVVQKRIDVARWLVRAEPELLQHRADGAFFAVGQPCNYGQVPLLFAAGTNQPEMFDMLVAEGADPDAVDSFGNNALHVCVEHDLPEMYVHVRQSWARDAGADLARAAKSDGGDALWKRMNGDGLTPLMLAARDGHREMFEALVELEAQVQWSYGPVSCVILPLRELDFIVGEPRGAIEWLVHNNHVEILQTTRVRELLDKKWAAFGQRLFMRKFRATCIYLAAFVATIVWGPRGYATGPQCAAVEGLARTLCYGVAGVAPTLLPGAWPSTNATAALLDHDAWQWAVVLAEFVVVAGAVTKFERKVAEMRQETLRGYLAVTGAERIENYASVAFCLLVFTVAGARAASLPALASYIPALRVLQCAAGAFYSLYFLLGFRLTGHFVVMLGRMLNDVYRFLAVSFVFVLFFSSAFAVSLDAGGGSFFEIMSACMGTTFGAVDVVDMQKGSPNPLLSGVLVVVTTVTMPVLLGNVLVAMMSDTYTAISEAAAGVWFQQRARISFSLEAEMRPEERSDPRNKYWVDVGGQRFLQVMEVNRQHFRKRPPATGGTAAAAAASPARD